jgi:hypothetical protein
MDNSSISSSVADTIPPLSQRLGASISYFTFALIGTIIYLTLLAAICKGRHKLSNDAFYLFVYSFAVADIGEIAFTNFVISVPLSFTGVPLYGNGALIRVLSFSDSFFYYAILSLVVLMALNRFLVFYNKSLCEKLFERPNIYFTLIIPWTVGFILDGCQYLMCGCIKTYDQTQFHFYYECSSDDKVLSVVYSYIDKVVNLGLPFFSLLLYLATFAKMKFMSSRVGPGDEQRSMVERRNKREKAFLIQVSDFLFHLFRCSVTLCTVTGGWLGEGKNGSLILRQCNMFWGMISKLVAYEGKDGLEGDYDLG